MTHKHHRHVNGMCACGHVAARRGRPPELFDGVHISATIPRPDLQRVKDAALVAGLSVAGWLRRLVADALEERARMSEEERRDSRAD